MEKIAEEIYNNYLDSIHYLIGNNTTYGTLLNKIGKQLFTSKFKGVYPSDKIPILNQLSKYCILNLDNSEEPGSHWIALALTKNNSIMVYDSFGRNHTKIIPNLNRNEKRKIINVDRDCDQDLLESNCGQRCLAWLLVFDNYGPDIAKLL